MSLSVAETLSVGWFRYFTKQLASLACTTKNEAFSKALLGHDLVHLGVFWLCPSAVSTKQLVFQWFLADFSLEGGKMSKLTCFAFRGHLPTIFYSNHYYCNCVWSKMDRGLLNRDLTVFFDFLGVHQRECHMWKLSINLAPTLSLVSCNYCINKLIMPMSLSVTHFDVAALIFEAKITGWVRRAGLGNCYARSRKKRQMNWGKNDRQEEAPKMHFFLMF